MHSMCIVSYFLSPIVVVMCVCVCVIIALESQSLAFFYEPDSYDQSGFKCILYPLPPNRVFIWW